ncbi:MAG TPA: hypothetical protein VH678_25335 [Xanthobacteraceae bacterium]|jgi:hypothetical protein
MLSPSCTKNVGSHWTNPNISVLIMINATDPTTMLGSKDGLNSDRRLNGGIGAAGLGGGSGPARAAFFSIDSISASASAARPCVSNHRGDSGRDLHRYHTTSEPSPQITNMGRQP